MTGIAAAFGSLWVTRGDPAAAELWRYDASDEALYGTLVRGRFTADLAARRGAMWVRVSRYSRYARVDAETNEVRLIPVRPPPTP